jgi:hypothetical protein
MPNNHFIKIKRLLADNGHISIKQKEVVNICEHYNDVMLAIYYKL